VVNPRWKRFGGALLFLGIAAVLSAGEARDPLADRPLDTVRIQDRVTLHARRAYLTFTETLVVTPIATPGDGLRRAGPFVVHLLIAPFWLRDGNEERLAFPVLRPQLNYSHGRVRRFALVRPDGETVRSVAEATPECRYVLTLDLGHVRPERISVTVQMSAPTGLSRGAELVYSPSNDGRPFRSGPPESFQTVVHILADEALEPWTAFQGENIVPRADTPPSVTLQREQRHEIRFGQRPEW